MQDIPIPADADLAQRVESLAVLLASRGWSMAAAESCTGGWIAKSITDIAGSSAVFGYGIVSYSNGAKESILGVKSDTLEESIRRACLELVVGQSNGIRPFGVREDGISWSRQSQCLRVAIRRHASRVPA